MLDRNKPIRQLLLIGKTIPVPAPALLVAALTSVKVTNDSANGDGFELTFALTRENPVEYVLLKAGLLDPDSRVVIAVTMGAIPEVLIDGVITHHQLDPGSGGGAPTLTVMGQSLSAMMDLEDANQQYPNQTDSIIVTRLIAKYARYGLIPDVMPTTNVTISVNKTPNQNETDLECIERLARKNGFVFYIEPVTIGVNKAYWGPEIRLGIPQPALTSNMGAWNNVTSMNFSLDPLAPTAAGGTFMIPIINRAVKIPSLPSLKIPPLSSRPVRPLRKKLLRDTAKKNAGEAATAAVAEITKARDAVTASGELDTVLYGHVLRARKLVGVRGAGLAYNGFYYVRSVTHMLERGSYKQSFTLGREGTHSITPIVRP